MHMVTMALFNLVRRPIRSLLTLLGMAAAMAGFVAMIGLSQGLERAWKNHFEIRGTDLLVFQKGAVEIFTTQIDARYGQTIAEIAGVKEVSGELADILLLEGRITTLAVGWPVESHLWKTVRLLEGRLPTETGEEAVLLGQSAAVALGKKPGDALFIRKRSLPVAGVIRQSGVIGSHSLILPLPTLQAINQHPGKVTVFHVQVQEPRTPEKIAEVRKRLQAALPDLTVMEQTREIGVLGAVGWSEGRVVGYVLLQGLILALGGGICGVLLGGGGLRWLTSFPQVGGLIEGRLSPSLLGEALLAVFLLGGLGSLYPAWRASRLNIVDALRYE